MADLNDRQRDMEARKLRIQMEKIRQGELEKDQVIQQEQKIVPVTAKEKTTNFWYHYKWVVLGTTLGVVLIIIFIVSMVTKVNYDVNFMSVSTLPLGFHQSTFESVLSEFTPDANKDDEKRLCFMNVEAPNPEAQFQDAKALAAGQTRLMAMLSTKDAFVFLLDETGLEHISKTGVKWLDLSTIAQSEHINGEKYMLKDTELIKKLGMEEALKDTFICVMDFEEASQNPKTKKKYVENYLVSKELMKNIIEFK